MRAYWHELPPDLSENLLQVLSPKQNPLHIWLDRLHWEFPSTPWPFFLQVSANVVVHVSCIISWFVSLFSFKFQIQMTPKMQEGSCNADELYWASSADSTKKLKCFPGFQAANQPTQSLVSDEIVSSKRRHWHSYGEIFCCAAQTSALEAELKKLSCYKAACLSLRSAFT